MVRAASSVPDSSANATSPEARASSFIDSAIRGGFGIRIISDTISARIRHYGERSELPSAIADILTDGTLGSELLRPMSVSVRRFVVENAIDAPKSADARNMRLSALDAREIEEALLRRLVQAHGWREREISAHEHSWAKHLAADMKVAALEGLMAKADYLDISVMLQGLASELLTEKVSGLVEDIIDGL